MSDSIAPMSWSAGLKQDLLVLQTMWLSPFFQPHAKDHAARLENFYSPQAHACECRAQA